MRPMEIADTHGISTFPGCTVKASSEPLAWESMYASDQRESPFSAHFSSRRDHLLVLHLGGPARVSSAVDGRRMSDAVLPGGIFLWPAGHDFEVSLEQAVDTFHLYVRSECVDRHAGARAGASLGGFSLDPQMHMSDTLLEQLVLEVRRLVLDADDASRLYADVLLQAICARLVSRQLSQQAGSVRRRQAGMSARQLGHVIAFIEASLDKNLSLSELSAVSGLSQSHFVRQFRRAAGLSPHQFIIKRRVERAKRLLELTNMSLVDVALECGFSHQEHLTNTFRRIVGTTPALFRRQLH